MCFLWRMLRISWTAKKSNETVLRKANERRSFINRIRKCQATFFWPCDEKRETRTSCDNWMIEGKRSRGKNMKRCWMG